MMAAPGVVTPVGIIFGANVRLEMVLLWGKPKIWVTLPTGGIVFGAGLG
jgi:hypothetical protein